MPMADWIHRYPHVEALLQQDDADLVPPEDTVDWEGAYQVLAGQVQAVRDIPFQHIWVTRCTAAGGGVLLTCPVGWVRALGLGLCGFALGVGCVYAWLYHIIGEE